MEALMTIGGFLPLPYVFYTVIQSVRRRGQVDFFGTLLAYAAVLIPVGLVTWAALNGGEQPFLTIAAVASAGIMLLFSVIIIVRDARTPDRSLNRSYGVLGLVVAFLIVAGVLVIPLVLPLIPGMTVAAAADTNTTVTDDARAAAFAARQNGTVPTDSAGTALQAPQGFGFAQDQTASDATVADQAAAAETTTSLQLPNAPAGFAMPQMNSGNAPTVEDEPVAQAEIAPTAIAPTPQASRLTYEDFAAQVVAAMEPISVQVGTSVTDSAGASVNDGATETGADLPSGGDTLVESGLTCVLTLQYNLNLREESSADSDLILTIPYTAPLTGSRTDDGWWHVSYNGIDGWISGEYVTTSPDCQ